MTITPLQIIIGLVALAFIIGLSLHRRRPGKTHTLVTATVFSPGWHNEKGWPALCVAWFPSVDFKPREVQMSALVTSTYEGPGLPAVEREEVVEAPPEIVIRELFNEGKQLKVALEVNEGILERAKAPEGYNALPTMTTVKVKLDLHEKAAR